MEKIALLTDSACDIDDDTIKRYGINVLPFRIIYKDREYIDKCEITPKYVYENMDKEIPKSSLPSPLSMEKIYKKLEKENYTHVIAVVISSGLSGTYNSLKIISEKHKDIKTYLYDSKSTSIGEGVILKTCGELIDEGKSFDEIIHAIPEIKKSMHFVFVFGTLEYAMKGGRIGRLSELIGDFLGIKPIVGFDDTYGQCFAYRKVRGRKHSLNALAEIGRKISEKKLCDVYIVHGNSEEDASKVSEMISRLPNIRNVYVIGQISAIVGVYSGPGTVGVCYKEC